MRTVRRSLRLSEQDRPSDREAGVTLVETLVAMTVFAILLVVVAAAITGMVRGTVRTQNTADVALQVDRAFTLFDQQVRSAEVVNAPGVVGTASYVEYRTPPATRGTPATCTQWRQQGSVLQVRSWSDGRTPTSAFRTVVDGVGPSTTATFALAKVDGAHQAQRLTVTLADLSAGATAAVATQSSLTSTFTARNSTADSTAGWADPTAGGYACDALANRP